MQIAEEINAGATLPHDGRGRRLAKDRATPGVARRDRRGCACGCGNRCALCGRFLPLSVPEADDLDGRTRRHPLSLARHAGRRAGVSACRAHENDGDHRNAETEGAGFSRRPGDCRTPRLPDPGAPPGLRVRVRRNLRHDSRARHFQCVAGGRPAGRTRSYDPVRCLASGLGRRLEADRRRRRPRRGRWRRALSAEPGFDPARQHQPSHLLRRTGGGDGVRGGADRVRVRPGDLRLHHPDDDQRRRRSWLGEWTKA